MAGPRRKARAIAAGPKSILFVNQHYWPSHASTAQHLTDLAESLVERGYECHVLCLREQAGAPVEEVHNGVHIHRVGSSKKGRMASYLGFFVHAVREALRLPRFDTVATLTTPPIIGLIGTMLRRLKGSIHVYWSMDLHPDASLALGRMSKRNPVVAALAWLSDAVYRQADRVVVLGPYMADRIAVKGVRPNRLTTIPVWSRRDEIYPLPREGHPLRRSLGLEDQFVAMYSGRLGLPHSADEILEAARRFQGRPEVVFLIVGDGPLMGRVRAAKRAEGLDNLRLLDYFPREQLYASLSLADCHLITMRREMTGVMVPSKVYGAMASGRPAIFVGPEHCEAADAIRQADCGLLVRPGDADGLVAALDYLIAHPEQARQMGERGRAAFLEAYEREGCCRQWGQLFAELVGEPGPAIVPVPALSQPRPQSAEVRRAS
ncbi:MAG: glycosyltransferase family 4 protein [Isosphaeraceae bacterium]|nr:glycosyltransferase family 4 protein [Isosphaeraceae bacterium]